MFKRCFLCVFFGFVRYPEPRKGMSPFNSLGGGGGLGDKKCARCFVLMSVPGLQEAYEVPTPSLRPNQPLTQAFLSPSSSQQRRDTASAGDRVPCGGSGYVRSHTGRGPAPATWGGAFRRRYAEAWQVYLMWRVFIVYVSCGGCLLYILLGL